MNKLLIVLLAVCLVSVHAFVKRDAPAPESSNTLNDITKKFQDFGEDLKKQISDAFDPEKLKKGFETAVNTITKAAKDLQTSNEQKPAAGAAA